MRDPAFGNRPSSCDEPATWRMMSIGLLYWDRVLTVLINGIWY
jgi:hypothetical protein